MIEDEEMDQPEEIKTNQDEREIEAGDLETKELENKNTRPRRANVGNRVERLLWHSIYHQHWVKEKKIMHDMHKLTVDVTFTQMTTKKGIEKHGERAVSAMYKEYTQLEDMKVMGEINSESLTRSHKKGELRAINLIKEKRSVKLKGRTCADGKPPEMLHNKSRRILTNHLPGSFVHQPHH